MHVRDLERPGRIMRQLYAAAKPRRRRLIEDPEFWTGAGDRRFDDDCELGAWPELVDQRQIGDLMADGCYHEDDEIDDDDTGIEDEAHDARTEDGL